MSTFNTQSTSAISNSSTAGGLPLATWRDGDHEPQWLGLPIIAWVKIGVIGLLMVALYWVNLSRLWAKTNPITGQGDWEHAIVIPLIGIYYLYVWRDQLLGVTKPDLDANRWTLPGIWALIMAVPLLLALVASPLLMAGVEGFNAREVLAGLADSGLSRLIPVGFGVIAVTAAAAGFVYVRRQDLQYPSTQVWLDNVWHGLGAWLMSMIVLWGIGFFAAVLLPVGYAGIVKGISYAIVAVGLAGLAHIAFWGSNTKWRQRYDAILSRSSAWFGAFVMLWGILFSFWGIWPGQNDFFKDVGMVVALFGVVTLVAGWRIMKIAWFPIVFLFCAIPWPDQVYSWVALPLQNFAAKIGVFALKLTGVDANQFGTKIVMAGDGGAVRTLNVAEACAGLKSLMTFVSVAAAVAFLSNRLLWQKVMIVASAVPIAIACNASRVAGQGLLDYYVSREWSENFAHAFAGLVMLIPGFFMILIVCWVLDHLFVEEVDDKPVVRRSPRATAGTPAALAPAASSPQPAVAAVGPSQRNVLQTAPTTPAAATPGAQRVITIPKKQAATPAVANPAPPRTAPPQTAPAAPARAVAAPVAPAGATAPRTAPQATTVAKPAVRPAQAAAKPSPTVPRPPAAPGVAPAKPAPINTPKPVARPAAAPDLSKKEGEV